MVAGTRSGRCHRRWIHHTWHRTGTGKQRGKLTKQRTAPTLPAGSCQRSVATHKCMQAIFSVLCLCITSTRVARASWQATACGSGARFSLVAQLQLPANQSTHKSRHTHAHLYFQCAAWQCCISSRLFAIAAPRLARRLRERDSRAAAGFYTPATTLGTSTGNADQLAAG